MAREFKTGYKVTGDASGGVRAAQATRAELDKLNNTIQNQTKLGKFAASETGKFTAGIAGMATVAVGAVVGIGRFAKSIAEQGDHVQKLAIQLGTSTEFISGMAHAAELSGSSLDGFAKAMAKMQRSVSDLGAGLSTQVRSFERLGLSYEQIRKLSPEDQFLEIADRIGSMGDASARTATAMELFGRSGATLIPLFVGGKDGIASMREEAERFGLVMSRDFADASAQFDDDLTRMQGISTGFQRQLAEGLLPELSAVMQAFIDSAESTDTWTEVGRFFGNLVRVLVAGFITLREIVILTGETIWATGKVIVETLIAIAAPVLEFGKTLENAFNKLISGDFAGAADAFSGLGDRMAAAFVDNISVVKLTLQEFGQDAAVRVKEAVEDINDVLTRQSVSSQSAAAGMDGLGDETGQSAKAAAEAAKAYETLVDRLDPLAKLQKQFTIEQAILAGKIAEGGDGVAYYTMLLEILKEEYGEAAREAVGFGEKAGAAAEKAAERAAKAAAREAEARAKELAKMTEDQETFQKAFERGIERLDDLGADLWRGWFTGAKDMLTSIKDFFLNWLAEMAHAAITRPILVNFIGAFGMGGSAMANAAMGGYGGPGGVGGIAGGGGGWGSLASLFTGSGIGNALATAGGFLPTWLGGTAGTGIMGPTAAGGNIAGGIFANAATIPNWAYGLYGLAGGFLGNLIAPNSYAGIGGGLGATVGAAAGVSSAGLGAATGAWAGPIGAAVGAAIGIAIGSFFKDRPPVLEVSTENRSGLSDSDEDRFYDSAFGGVNLRSRRIKSETLDEFGQGVAALDDYIAQFVDTAQKEEITAALANFSQKMEGEIDFQKVLNARFDTILGTFSQEMQDYVNEFTDLESKINGLGMAAAAQSLIDAAPELFEGRTFRDFIAVAEAMQAEGEELTDTFQRLFSAVVEITKALEVVRGYADSDLAADFDALIAQQGMTLREVAAGMGDQIRELRAGFTGSADDLAKLVPLIAQRYQTEIAYLTQINQFAQQIANGSKGLREQILQDQLGPEGFYNEITSQAERLAQDLKSMTDPQAIAATVAEIQRLTGVAYGLLDEDQRKAKGGGFLDFLDDVESGAQDALQLARDLFIEESEVLRDLVTEMADSFADPLAIAATAHEGAAEALSQSAMQLSNASQGLGQLAQILPGFIREGLNGIGLDIRQAIAGAGGGVIANGGAGAAPAGGSLQQVANLMAAPIVAAIVQSGNTAAGAIQSSVGRIQPVIQMPRTTNRMVNR